MCCSRIQPSPIADIVEPREQELFPEPVEEDQVEDVRVEDVDFNLEEHLLRSIEEAAIENQRLHETVRLFQEIIQEQTDLLEEHVRIQLARDENNNLTGAVQEQTAEVAPRQVQPTADWNGTASN